MSSTTVPNISPPQEYIPGVKRRRQAWSMQQKQEICLFHEQNPDKTQDDIAQHFSALWNVKLERTIVTKTLKKRATWLAHTITSANATVKRQRKPSHEALENALFGWHQQTRAQGVLVTDAQVTDKALVIARDMGMSDDDFKASNGWLYKFKKRHSIRSYGLNGQPEPEPALEGMEYADEVAAEEEAETNDIPSGPVALNDARRAAAELSTYVYNHLDDVVLHPSDLTYLSGLQNRLERLATSHLMLPSLRSFYPARYS